MISAYEHGQNAEPDTANAFKTCPFDPGTVQWCEWEDLTNGGPVSNVTGDASSFYAAALWSAKGHGDAELAGPRARTRITCAADQAPPLGVGTPRSVRPAATARNESCAGRL